MIGGRRSIPLIELRAVVSHVRQLETGARRASRVSHWTYAALFVILLGSIRVGASSAYLSSSRPINEESRMRTLQNLGVVSSIAIASVATAQNAVEWRVADGGNGHWYASAVLPGTGMNWTNARVFAQGRGADLASLETSAEAAFATPLVNTNHYAVAWIGLFQPATACEPSCGWSWVSGAPLSDQSWGVGEPNNNGGDTATRITP